MNAVRNAAGRRIIAGSVGGTGPDFIARMMAPKFGGALRQMAVAGNRAGESGMPQQ